LRLLLPRQVLLGFAMQSLSVPITIVATQNGNRNGAQKTLFFGTAKNLFDF